MTSDSSDADRDFVSQYLPGKVGINHAQDNGHIPPDANAAPSHQLFVSPTADVYDPRFHSPPPLPPPTPLEGRQEHLASPTDMGIRATNASHRLMPIKLPQPFHELVGTSCGVLKWAHQFSQLPHLYCMADRPVFLAEDDKGHKKIKTVYYQEHMQIFLSQCIAFIKKGKDDDDPDIPVDPPDKLCKAIIADPGRLPRLNGITNKPILRSDGSIQQNPGFDPATGYYFDPVGMPPITIPDQPTHEDVAKARMRLMEPFTGFCFKASADLANYLALLITLIVRSTILGNVPLFVIDSPIQGSGKSKLAFCASLIATGGREASMVMPERGGDDEIRKRLTAHLIDNPLTGMLDNIVGKVDWPSLASILTTGQWSDRLLQKSKIVTMAVQTVFFCTGVNIEIAGDMARRCIYINLDPGIDKPWERTFAFDPEVYVRERRAELLESLFILVRHWFALGKPTWSGTALGSFESWTGMVGGILNAAGIEGFLGNRNIAGDAAIRENSELALFYKRWVYAFREPQRAADVASLLIKNESWFRLFQGYLPEELLLALDHREGNAAVRFGKALGKFKNRVAGGYKLIANLHSDGVMRWTVVPADQSMNRPLPGDAGDGQGVRSG